MTPLQEECTITYWIRFPTGVMQFNKSHFGMKMMKKKKLPLRWVYREGKVMKEDQQEEHKLLLGKKKTMNLEEPNKEQPSPKIWHKQKEEEV